MNSKGRSAVGIKADAVRIIGREGVKIVTRTEGRNSLKEKITTIPGIDLIAGNDPDDMQPLVKADNLARGLQKLGDLIQQVCRNLILTQQACQAAFTHLSVHRHPLAGDIPFLTAPVNDSLGTTTGAAAAIAGAEVDTANVSRRIGIGWKKTYTDRYGEYWIGSHYNNTN